MQPFDTEVEYSHGLLIETGPPERGGSLRYERGTRLTLPDSALETIRNTLFKLASGQCIAAIKTGIHERASFNAIVNECELMQQRRNLAGDLISVQIGEYQVANGWKVPTTIAASNNALESELQLSPKGAALVPYTAVFELTEIPGYSLIVKENGTWTIITMD